MRFGLRVTDYLGDVHALVGLAVAAETAGFDMVWSSHDPFMKNTWVTTSAMAQATRSIQVGSVGTTPYLTDPAEVATYVATLDELSGGRAVLGYGIHTADMVAWVGYDADDVVPRLRASVEMIRSLLRGEVVERHGSPYAWSDQCYLRFRPVRREVPIYVCPFGPGLLRLSGEIGDGSLPMVTPPASAARMVAEIRAGADRRSGDAADLDIAGCAWVCVAEDPRAAEATTRRLIAYFGPYLEAEALRTIGLEPADFDVIRQHLAARDLNAAAAAVTPDMLRLAISGTPRDVIRALEDLGDAGITQVSIGGSLGPDPRAAVELMGQRVLPHFR